MDAGDNRLYRDHERLDSQNLDFICTFFENNEREELFSYRKMKVRHQRQ